MSDPMFDYVLARSRARETSILAVATIASSASIVLLGLALQCNCSLPDNTKSGITIFGIAFAGLGFAYREVTIKFIHKNDELWLKEYVQSWRELNRLYSETTIGERVIDGHCIKDPIPPHSFNGIRDVVIRTLLIIPILAWLLFIDQYIGIGMSGLSIGLIVGYSSCHGD